MTNQTSGLDMFDAIKLGDMKLQNRIIMAPMSRNRATTEGLATPLMATYYAQRADAGLIISEGIQPSQQGQGFMNSPGLHSEAQVESWKQVTAAVHAKGGKIIAQLMHAGRIGHPSLYPSQHLPVGPSPIAAQGQTFTPTGMEDYPTPIALTVEAIKQTIEDFARAAKNAIRAGFDGVEIHAGNGFLLHQFLSDNTNQRNDIYGGDISRRSNFTLDVVDAVIAEIGKARTGIRLSPDNPYNDIHEAESVAQYQDLLSRLPDIAFIHIMEAGNREHILALRQQWQGAFLLNPHETSESGPVTPEIAEKVLSNNTADAVCFGALFIANPDLITRIKEGAPFNEMDGNTLYGGDHRGYTDYPALEMSVA
ncbi:alkene reductase [Flocculibacter collagenilyticus]|uniref:alkene reductase n=1 Tax=Flocculibacter collagenilyticus TaxID=2744479 RepID=UPI001F258393|nr:alkene reductase [Flocculibacter collagenilyticus]